MISKFGLLSRKRAGRFAWLAVAALLAAPTLWLPAHAQRARTADFADLVDDTIDTVVNISTSARVEANRSSPTPQLPPGIPGQELLEEFFNRRFGDQDGQRRGGGGGGGGGQNEQRRVASQGSGFVIDSSGIIVTNNHVIDGADEINAIFHDGKRLKATVLGRDPRLDIAVLKVEPTSPLKATRFGDSDKARVGEWVMAIGNPLGFGGTVTAGILSARNRDINSGPYDSYLQTDAPINRGNSGGPLFNTNGEVIGINTAIVSPSGGSIGIGFAIPANLAMPVVQQLREFGETRRGWIGVRLQAITDELATDLGIGKARGALVAGLTKDGPAAKAGLKTGDVIIRFNGRDVAEMRELPTIVAGTPNGTTVPIVVIRTGKETPLDITVGRLEENDPDRKDKPVTGDKTPPPADVGRSILGMSLSGITQELRKRYRINDELKGVVITKVDGGSPAAERGLQAGLVVTEVGQETVSSAADVQKRLDALRGQGRKTALFLVANAQGELRFVTLNIESK
ncbi:MAG: Do family serine endopeptidase [Hyphomicrobiales bacterium]|nr:Do family serine endopeptidase [Hyphomicrobiales bacterium]OQW84940.1 MAG: serine protease [Proteobacteria bacterium ST_bin15]